MKLSEPLPSQLQILYCCNNNLVTLPPIPFSVTKLICWGNPFLYVSEEIRRRYGSYKLDDITNYPLIVQNLKEIHMAQGRKTILKFCDKIHDQSNEFRYRPTGSGYLELKILNKNKFIDL